MGGFRHGGPLMGYRDGGWPPWKKSILPYQDLPYEGIGLNLSKPAQGSLLGRAGKGIAGGLPGILIAELLGMSAFPDRMGAGTVDEWKEREQKLDRLRDLIRIAEEQKLEQSGYFNNPIIENKPYVFSSSGAMGRRR